MAVRLKIQNFEPVVFFPLQQQTQGLKRFNSFERNLCLSMVYQFAVINCDVIIFNHGNQKPTNIHYMSYI